MSVIQKTIASLEYQAKLDPVILVGFSGGKDSLAVLDLCVKTFKEVRAFFKYLVPGLEVIEKQMRFAKERYGVDVIQFPSLGCIEAFRSGLFCDPVGDFSWVPASGLPLKTSFAYAMEITGAKYMATGMKDADGLPRRQFFANIRDGGDPIWSRVIHPIREWSKKDVLDYLKVNDIPLPECEDGKVTSGVGLNHDCLCWLHDKHPADFEKLLTWFPYAKAAIKRREFFDIK